MNAEMMEWWAGWADVNENLYVDWHMNRIHREYFDQDNLAANEDQGEDGTDRP